MKTMSLLLIILAVALLPVLSACGAPNVPNNIESLGGTSWQLVSYGPTSAQQPAAPGVETSLVFGADGKVSGTLGCNGLSGDYTVSDQNVTFGALIVTKMACEEPQMTQENTALQVLTGTASFVITDDGTQMLEITSADGRSSLTLTEITGQTPVPTE